MLETVAYPVVPFKWIGHNWLPNDTVRFEDGLGRRLEIGAVAALQCGLFDLDTTTPAHRDFLRRWAEAVQAGRDAALICTPAVAARDTKP